MASVEEILKASDVLLDISRVNVHDLLPHQGKLHDALHNLQKIVDDARGKSQGYQAQSPHFRSVSPDYTTSVSPASTIEGRKIPSPSDGVPSAPLKLLASLEAEKERKKIESYLSSWNESIRTDWDWTQEDPRIIDLCVNAKSPFLDALNIKVRKCLSRQSLVTEYTSWEKRAYGTSKVDDLCRDLATAAERSDGHISEFIELNKDRFHSKSVAENGIKQGIKERVFGLHFGYQGILVILATKFRLFRAVKYREFPVLKKLFENSTWATIAQENSASFDAHRSLYDVQYDEWFRKRAHSSPEIIHGTKRCNSELYLADTRTKHRRQASLSTNTNIACEQHGQYSIEPLQNVLNDCVPYFSLADDFSSPDAPDTWAAAGSMAYNQISPDMLPAVDVPRPGTTDA